MIHGFATHGGTTRYADNFPEAQSQGFFQLQQNLCFSCLGMGTYLGVADDERDQGYTETALEALRTGVNVFDTSLNYRNQRSEHALADAFRFLLNSNEVQRDQFAVATKAGFLTPDAIPDFLKDDDIVDGIHSLHPDFLEDQLNRSRTNLDLDTIDIFYLHNPEIQLSHVRRDVFEHRLQLAFERLERLAGEHKIRYYGTATWDGYRQPDQMNLERVIDLARYVGGTDHHLRFIQLPFNLGMTEAYVNRNHDGVSVLKIAARAGITVVASATLAQGQFARGLLQPLCSRLPRMKSDATRAIQFTRSTPGVGVTLVGMSRPAHLRENLEIAGHLPLGVPDYEKLYRPVEA